MDLFVTQEQTEKKDIVNQILLQCFLDNNIWSLGHLLMKQYLFFENKSYLEQNSTKYFILFSRIIIFLSCLVHLLNYIALLHYYIIYYIITKKLLKLICIQHQNSSISHH